MPWPFKRSSKPESATKSAAPQPPTPNEATMDVYVMREAIIEQLRHIYDPEIPVNIYDLGLIYEVHVNDAGKAHVLMTLTAPACPAAEILPEEVKERTGAVPGVTEVEVELTFDPPWGKDMMSEEAQLELGFL
ncbi:MAG: iron-sulfur cluster assembly protein [Bacteroidia bacterium]